LSRRTCSERELTNVFVKLANVASVIVNVS
jgi:hypothetical protein